jgi:hypothetical protein
MKKIILLFITLFCVSFSYAQPDPNPPLTNEEFFTKAELVFEGKFLRKVYTYNLNGTKKYDDCYTIMSYIVQKVYKGDHSLEGKVIYQVTKGGYLGNDNQSSNTVLVSSWIPRIFRMNGIDEGVNIFSPQIFFFISSDLPDDVNSKYYSYKKYKRLRDYFEGKFSDEMYVTLEDKILGLNNLVFHQRKDFYNYMRQFEGFTVPEPELHLTKPEKEMLNETVIDSIPYEKP